MRAIALSVCCIAFVGCASAAKTTFLTTNPTDHDVANEVLVEKPFEEVWDSLVAELSKSFFVVNNIAKDSRLINLSFSTDQPEEYVDCGRTTRTYKKGSEDYTYDYAIAEDSAYKFSKQLATNAYANYDIARATGLEGRINVYVAPQGGGTKVSVNCRYVFSVKTSGTYETIGGALEIRQDAGPIPSEERALTFNTGAPGHADWGTPSQSVQVTCVSRGVLESTILEMVSTKR